MRRSSRSTWPTSTTGLDRGCSTRPSHGHTNHFASASKIDRIERARVSSETTMQGVTTALVAFIFFCVIFPERVKSRAQFYAGLGLICAIILLDALGYMIGAAGFRV